MVVDDLSSVIHAAVTDFDWVTIKDSSEFVVFQEMLIYKGKELVSNIGADNFAEWGIVPEYVVPLSAFWLLVVGGL